MTDSQNSWRLHALGMAGVIALGAVAIIVANRHADRQLLAGTLTEQARAYYRDTLAAQAWQDAHRRMTSPQRAPHVAERLTGSDTASQVRLVVRSVRGHPGLIDAWEQHALQMLAAGQASEVVEHVSTEGRTELRFLAPVHADASCATCHHARQPKPGEVAGGVSIRFDISRFESSYLRNLFGSGMLALGLIGGAGLLIHRHGRRSERQIALLNERFRDVANLVADWIWETDSDGRYVFVGCREAEILGYPPDALLGSSPNDLLRERDGYDLVAAIRATAHKERALEDTEVWFSHADGSYRCLLTSGKPIRDRSGKVTGFRGTHQDITRRKEIEARNEQNLAEKEAILQNALVGIVYLRQRTIMSCNRRFEEIFGYAPGELDGRSTECLYASRETFLDIGARAYPELGEGRSYRQEAVLRRANGGAFWGAINGRAIDPARPHEGSIWIYADISERKQAEEELQKLFRAVEQCPVSVIITDQESRIEYVNPRFSQVTGYSRAESLGRNPRFLRSDLTPRETHEELWSTITSGREWHGVLCNRKKNGELFWEEASISPILNEDGAVTHYLAVKEDISERKLIDEQLAQYRDHLEELVNSRTLSLIKASEEAKAAERAKSEFLMNMSHEIRTPMNAIIGFANLALRSDLTPRQQDYLRKISDAGEHLLELINNMLDLSRIAAGRVDLLDEEFDLRQLTARLSSMMGYKAAEKRLSLDCVLAPEIPPLLVGDSLRLSQVLMNLLANAIKFTERGQIRLRIDCRPSGQNQVELAFQVADSGIGIAADDLPKLFQPFSQADASVTRRFGGSGLGLAISKQLVELMGGRLSVASEPGVGSRFFFTLTLTQPAPRALPAPPPSAPAEPSPAAFNGVRILLAEDQPLNREVACELLAAVGVRVDIAETGEEALDRLFSQPADTYAMVLMDIQMPRLDGLSATEQIRRRPEFAELPIIALTAHVMDTERERARAAGVSDHLGKPFSPSDLYAVLGRWLHYRRSAATAPGSGTGTTEAAEPPDTEPLLDAAVALPRFGNQESRYRYWLENFVQEQHDVASTLAVLLQNAQHEPREKAARLLHALKGSAGTLGLSALHRAAERLEREARCGRANPAQVEAFCACHAQSLAAATQWLAPGTTVGDAAAPSSPTPVDGLPLTARQVRAMLASSDGNSEEAVAAFLAALGEQAPRPLCKALLAAVRRFDHAAALRHFDELIIRQTEASTCPRNCSVAP